MTFRRTVAVLSVVVVGAMGCSSSGSTTATEATRTPGVASCPTAPVSVVVTVDQWGGIVKQLAGACGEVTTIIEGSTQDPHDYEPTPGDAAKFSDADLVVLNGLDYDHWAEDAVDSLSTRPTVVDGGAVVGLSEGVNPHLWYSPDYVQQIADAVTSALEELAPAADAYFAARQADWRIDLQPYLQEVSTVRRDHSGATFAATESVFDYMAGALGLESRTPSGYENAAANESEPSPGDLDAFEQALRSGQIDVLIYNTQTEGAVPEQLRSEAENDGVPVVEVTETVPPGQASFIAWQLGQLRALSSALST